jgi:YesN/AraC family two-component response regulator
VLHLHRRALRVPSQGMLLPDPVPLFSAINRTGTLGEVIEIILCFYELCLDFNRKSFSERYSTPVCMALTYLQDFHAKSVALEDLAAACGLSPGHVSRLLKKETGSTFSELLQHIRIGEAVRYLCSSNFKVYEIAEKVGFENPAYFHQVFKRVTGYSPKDYVRKADKMIDFLTFPAAKAP